MPLWVVLALVAALVLFGVALLRAGREQDTRWGAPPPEYPIPIMRYQDRRDEKPPRDPHGYFQK